MKEMWAKRHPLIAGVIITVLGSMAFQEPRSLVVSIFLYMSNIIMKGSQWLASDVNIPWWLLMILCLLPRM
ncbi:MAG: hypothetical protein BA863_00005 [Desulfovibrio sp. S3730MH75]|nr:MAG: hypothetical protein BA863_00005 [Desulfovibrio sp. S3730MH75]